MKIIPYALMTYGMTAVISFLVVGIIVVTNKVLCKSGGEDNKDD